MTMRDAAETARLAAERQAEIDRLTPRWHEIIAMEIAVSALKHSKSQLHGDAAGFIRSFIDRVSKKSTDPLQDRGTLPN
jgi:hypothetical protein